MNKFLRSPIYPRRLSLAMTGAIIFSCSSQLIWEVIQGTVFQLAGRGRLVYWNVAVLVILIAVNLKYNWFI